jgi:hypothetical protein
MCPPESALLLAVSSTVLGGVAKVKDAKPSSRVLNVARLVIDDGFTSGAGSIVVLKDRTCGCTDITRIGRTDGINVTQW